MKNLLKFEYRKLFTSKVFYICCILSAALVGAYAITTNQLLGSAVSNYPTADFVIKVMNNSYISIILAIFIAIFACSDFTHETMKVILSKGYSRQNIFLSKLICVLSASLIMFIFSIIIAFIIGTTTYAHTGVSTNLFKILCVQAIIILAFSSLFFMVSMILKKAGSAIAINIVSTMIISVLLIVINQVLNIKKFSLDSYWLGSLFSNVSTISVSHELLMRGLICSIIYIICFIIIGFFVFKSNEK